MRKYNTGAKVQYVCPECDKKGNNYATGYDVDMKIKRKKESGR